MNTIDGLKYLIVICFCFLNLVFCVAVSGKGTFYRMMGSVFFAPLAINIIAFVVSMSNDGRQMTADLLALLGEASFGFIFLTALAFKKIKDRYKILVYFSVLLPPVLLCAVYLIKPFQGIPVMLLTAVLWIIIGLFSFLRLSKDIPANRLPYYGLLLLCASALLPLLSPIQVLAGGGLILKAGGYCAIFVYLYTDTFKKMAARLEQAERKFSDINWEIHKEVRKRTKEIEITNERLLNISKIDGLTSILNKKAILDEMDNRIANSRVTKFAVLMFDIDKFKNINDTLGHVTGDVCIKKLATIGKACIRELDIIGRFGGDEFLILLHNAAMPQAKLIADRLRSKVSEGTDPHFTISIGMACYPEDGATVQELIAAADKGVYFSKSKKGNSVSYKNIK